MLRTDINQYALLAICILAQCVYGRKEENNKNRREISKSHWDDDDEDDGDCLYHISDETWVWIITGIVVAVLALCFCAYCGVRFFKRRRIHSELRENLVENARQPQAPSNSSQSSYIPPQNINQSPYLFVQPNNQVPQNTFVQPNSQIPAFVQPNYPNQYNLPPNQAPAQPLYPQMVPIVQNNPQQGLYPVLQPLPNQPQYQPNR